MRDLLKVRLVIKACIKRFKRTPRLMAEAAEPVVALGSRRLLRPDHRRKPPQRWEASMGAKEVLENSARLGFDSYSGFDASAEETAILRKERLEAVRPGKKPKLKFDTSRDDNLTLPSALGGQRREDIRRAHGDLELPAVVDMPETLSYGPDGGVGAVVRDALGRRYRVGASIWAIQREETEEGLEAEERKEARDAAEKAAKKRRSGQV